MYVYVVICILLFVFSIFLFLGKSIIVEIPTILIWHKGDTTLLFSDFEAGGQPNEL